MLKIKIIVYAFLISSLFTFSCASNGAKSSADASENRIQTGGAEDLTQANSNSPATQKDGGGTGFKGLIGSAEFQMTLRRAGAHLSGSYFYAKSGSGKSLALDGEIEADGKFVLRETDASGKQTGEFKGVWKDEPNESGAALEGEWTKPNAKDSVFFHASEEVILFTSGSRLTEKQIHETIKAKRIEIAVAYPELIGGANAEGFNRAVKMRVDKVVAASKKEMMGASAEDLKMMPEATNYSIDIGYGISYADDELVSIDFSRGTYDGGVHPNSDSFTVNYDLKNGRELKLAELFKPGAKYLETISAHAVRNLQSRKDDETGENMGFAQDMWVDGATPEADNYRSWNITKKGLMFTFDSYQVAPYAAGPQTVVVPFAKLKAIAKADGALAKFIK